MKQSPFKPIVWMGVFILIISLACNAGGATPTSPPAPLPPTAVPQPTQPPSTPVPAKPTEPPVVLPTQTLAPTKSGAVSSLGDVEKAVIRIVAEGSWREPEGWNVNVGYTGSGFLIDPSGIAVTNNHVVTGAALLKVYIAGDSTPHNARVLGVSECSDLAVIQIDGSNFPYLEWYQDPIKVGTKIYAAGYPVTPGSSEQNYTLTDGIVSVAAASGRTVWSSVEHVIQHSAKINPGNSGGPLVTEDGKIVGINYAGISTSDQNFAISRDSAVPVIDQLRTGKDVDSIGVNGITLAGYTDPNGNPIYGVWVRGVKPGSPADKARVEAGDIIYHLAGEVLATDGTMGDYCDVIRSHRPGDTMDLAVIRYNDLTILEGQLNGRELAVTGVFAGAGSADATPTADTSGAYTYSKIQDATGTIQVEIPTAWSDVNDTVWSSDWGGITFDAPRISAAPNLTDWANYQAPGVFFAASDKLGQIGGFIELLDGVRSWFSDCTFDSRNDYGRAGGYNDPLYEGKFDLYKKCGSNNTEVLMLAARPKADPTAYLILVEIHVLSDADTEALFHILDSFEVIGSF